MLKKHLNKIKDCSINKLKSDGLKFPCEFCNNKYRDKYSLVKHYNTCKTKKEHVIQDQLTVMNDKIKELENKIVPFANPNNVVNNTSTCTSTSTNINSNNTINNVMNITILPFDKPNNYFNNKEKTYLFDRGYKSIEECIKQKHFNKAHPENHNVYISNNRDKYVNLFNGDDWVIEDKNEIIDKLITDNTEYLVENFNNMMDELDTRIVNKFSKLKHDIEENNENLNDFSNRMKDNIKILLYNNRNLIISTIKMKTLNKIKN